MNPVALLPALGAAAGWLVAALVFLWLWSVPRRDVTLVDVFWGLGFVLCAVVYRLQGPEPAAARQILLLILVTVWGGRLAAYLAWRSRGESEDRRYAALRRRFGSGFWWQSLFVVFLLQGGLIVVVSLPFLLVEAQAVEGGWRLTDVLGLGLWLVGFLFEAGGDWQMARFKDRPENRGRVLDRGFWRYTRHPNYFGDFLQHWAFFVIALGAPHGWWALPAPIVMSVLLLRVSGVTLLEKDIEERRPAYREYQRRTNAFFPGPRRRGS